MALFLYFFTIGVVLMIKTLATPISEAQSKHNAYDDLKVVGGHSDRNRSRSRIINKDKEPPNDYPWIAGVMKEYTMLNPDLTEARDLCTGSLISETYILTAAHCICWFDDRVDRRFKHSEPNSRPSLRCKSNIERNRKNGKKYTKYVNQIQDNSDTDFNHIYFVIGAMKLPEFDGGAGSATSSNQWSKSKKAIIMDTRKTGNKINFSKAYDVGLILVPETESTTISIHRFSSEDKLDDTEGVIGGYGIKFAFGTHSDKSLGTENNPSKYSSCMTSEKGPVDSRFKYCDTSKIFDQGCKKDSHPEDNTPKRKDCTRDWLDARYAIQKRDLFQLEGTRLDEKFGMAHRIRVYASKPNRGRALLLRECIPMKWIRKYGWCYIADDSNKGWGICSPSCEFLGGNFAKIQDDDVYHEMKVLITDQHVYSDNLYTACGLTDLGISNEAEICLKAKPPETDTWQFERDKKGRINFQRIIYKEDIGRTHGYLGAGGGDSGGPILIKNEIGYELIGIVRSGKRHAKAVRNKPVQTEGLILGTKINEKILKWIQDHALLSN